MHRHEPLITDGHVDTIVRQTAVPAIALSPPLSVTTTVQDDASPKKIEVLSLNGWKPYYLTTLSSLPFGIRHKIPARKDMATFSFDMLQNTFGGIAWSPGLRYIKMSSAPVLRNRTYYMLDPANEPYLPQIPGEHGAKLTAFFNKAPEEEFDNLPKGTNSYTNVPMFVRVSGGRYVYFGDYSQTRWSDKLDNDTMRTRVPQRVKEYLAKELTATPREDWVTRELKKHFFPKPEYEGNILIPTSDDATISTVNEEKHSKQIAIDIKEYVGELAEWEREANMKTAMMKPDFILNAFDAVSRLAMRDLHHETLTSSRLMLTIHPLCGSGGSISSASTGSLTSTICLSVSKLALTTLTKRSTTACTAFRSVLGNVLQDRRRVMQESPSLLCMLWTEHDLFPPRAVLQHWICIWVRENRWLTRRIVVPHLISGTHGSFCDLRVIQASSHLSHQ